MMGRVFQDISSRITRPILGLVTGIGPPQRGSHQLIAQMGLSCVMARP